MKSNYFEKTENRIQRFKELAAGNERLSVSLFQRSSELGKHIPFGQPILVGHHSEARHRSDLNRITSAMDKSLKAGNKADYYAGKAAAAENNKAISSDNPEAIELLHKKLEGLERAQNLYKDINKIVKSKKLDAPGKIAEIIKLGVKEETAARLLEPDFCGRIGIPSYQITNNGATIRNTKERIEYLSRMAKIQLESWGKEGIELTIDPDDNRVKFTFPGKPSEETRSKLKGMGFKWAPSVMAWVRLLSPHAIYIAKDYFNKYESQ